MNRRFVVVNDSTHEQEEMNQDQLEEFIYGLDMLEEDEEVLLYWASHAASGETSCTGIWGPYWIKCL